MSGDVQVELWLHEYKLNALAAVLEEEGLTVEQRMQDALTELYVARVPPETRKEISARIKEELAAREAEIEASRQYAVFRVTENGVTEHFRMEQAAGMVEAASFVRRWLRQTKQQPFQEMLPGRESISAEEFDRVASDRVLGDQRVTGVYDVDLDGQEFSAVRPELGWITYRLKDVSTASWHSYRSGSYDRERRQCRLMEKLADREIPSAGHLSAESIVFSDEISEINGLLNFYMTADFDVDKMFGTHVCTEANDDTLNVYANYDCASGQVCDELEVDLHRADGREESVPYVLNAAEKEILLRKMDAYCQEQTGQTLAGYSARLMAEEMAPPAAPSM